MPRFPIDKNQITEGNITITGSDYRHITKVLRLKQGDSIDLFDNHSIEYRGRIAKINSTDLIVKIHDSWETETESNIQIDLYQSIIKPGKMDLVIQKAAELGVSNIIPISTERTQKGLQVKVERLSKISMESAKQCRRSKSPIVHKQTSFENVFKNNGYDLKLILYENSENSLRDYLNGYKEEVGSVSVLIGPEGGFTDEEVNLAEKNNYLSLSLGKRILRAETAAITMVSLLQFKFGDLG